MDFSKIYLFLVVHITHDNRTEFFGFVKNIKTSKVTNVSIFFNGTDLYVDESLLSSVSFKFLSV